MSASTSSPFPAKRPFRVLIVRTGAMGDVLHAMPAVAAMRLLHPDWRIGWAIEPRWRPLLEGNCKGKVTTPLVNKIHNVPTSAWNRRPVSMATLREILALRRELRAEKYDLCVDMQGLLRSGVVGWLAGATRFVGAAVPRERAAGWFYSLRVKTSAAHVIDRGCELLGSAIGEDLMAARVPLPVDAAAEQWCDALIASLPKNLAGCDRPFAMIAPTAGWGSKRWPAVHYGELAATLANAGVTTLINAAKEHDPVAAEVVKASGGCAVPVVCSLTELLALLRRASVMIAGDTGPLHLAAALGRPVVGLFGPTNPARTGPYVMCSRVLRSAVSRDDPRRHAAPEKGLAQIPVDEVAAAALEIMQPVPDGRVRV